MSASYSLEVLRSTLGVPTRLWTGSAEVPCVFWCFFCSFCIFCIICTCLHTVTGIFYDLVQKLHLVNLHCFTRFECWNLLHHHKRTSVFFTFGQQEPVFASHHHRDAVMSSARSGNELSARFCVVVTWRSITPGTSTNLSNVLTLRNQDMLGHTNDLLLKDRILSLHGVLDDLGLFHLHCVDDVLDMHVHKLFNGLLLDPVLRRIFFDWSCVCATCCVIFETWMIGFCRLWTCQCQDLSNDYVSEYVPEGWCAQRPRSLLLNGGSLQGCLSM